METKASDKDLLTIQVAGTKHYPGYTYLDQIKPEGLLIAVREPDNPHDKYAVSLHWDCGQNNLIKLGYIPATHSQTLSVLIANNIPVCFRCTKHVAKGGRIETILFTASLCK